MAALNGKWKIVSSDNAAAYFKSIGYTDEVIKEGAPLDDTSKELIDTITITDTHAHIVNTMDGEEKTNHKMELNKEFEHTSHGVTAKILVTIDGGVLKTVQKNDAATATYTRKVDGDTQTLEMTSDKGVVATRKLKKIA